MAQRMTPDRPVFSIIIPLHRDGPQFRLCLERCLALDYDRYEIIVVTDRPVAGVPAPARMVLTGSPADTGPGKKRDLAAAHARGDVLAFLDDDAFPARDWLSRAAAALRRAGPDVAAVGGPGLTPPASSLAERLGGAFYESLFGSGGYRYRFVRATPRLVDDYPAYNLLVRAGAFRAAGGYGNGFYGGEDTVLCLKLCNAGYRILYDPDVVVYHHRRPVLRRHLRQVGNVGLHRGHFFKAFPETSRRASYLLPSLFSALVGAALCAAVTERRARPLLLVTAAAGYAAIAADGVRRGAEPAITAALPLVVAASHVTYGVMFVRGLLTPELVR